MANIGMESVADVTVHGRIIMLLETNCEIIDLGARGPEAGSVFAEKNCNHNDFRYIVPICSANGLDGFVVLGRPINSSESYGQEDFDLMDTLARQASFALLSLRLSEQLARSRELAAIGKVSAFVMHDLKNLGSTMSLLLVNARKYILQRDFQKELLASLGVTVARMNALATRLTRLPEKMSLMCEPVDLLQMVQETACLIKGAQFAVTGRPVIARIDREEFRKVILNLMLNAAEASHYKGLISVQVGAEHAPYVKVTDEGCGISVDYLCSHLFTPFRSTKVNGLGIGLYQSKQIVEAHGGKIEVESEPNRGSAFTVWLPAVS